MTIKNNADLCEVFHVYKEKIESHSNEIKIIEDFISFLKTEKNCFHRTNLKGHITASAVVANKYFTKVLFTYHAKLKKWLQLGGHCDGNSMTHLVALKEAQEESGIQNFDFIDILNFPNLCLLSSPIIPLDIDIHVIPERADEPEHYHYDIRYLMVADDTDPIYISSESIDLKWISLGEIFLYTQEPGTLRMIEKINLLLNKKKKEI